MTDMDKITDSNITLFTASIIIYGVISGLIFWMCNSCESLSDLFEDSFEEKAYAPLPISFICWGLYTAQLIVVILTGRLKPVLRSPIIAIIHAILMVAGLTIIIWTLGMEDEFLQVKLMGTGGGFTVLGVIFLKASTGLSEAGVETEASPKGRRTLTASYASAGLSFILGCAFFLYVATTAAFRAFPNFLTTFEDIIQSETSTEGTNSNNCDFFTSIDYIVKSDYARDLETLYQACTTARSGSILMLIAAVFLAIGGIFCFYQTYITSRNMKGVSEVIVKVAALALAAFCSIFGCIGASMGASGYLREMKGQEPQDNYSDVARENHFKTNAVICILGLAGTILGSLILMVCAFVIKKPEISSERAEKSNPREVKQLIN